MPNRVQKVVEEPFLLQKDTLDALDALLDLDELVFYCGAGVTIDQTGVNWNQLVHNVFQLARVLKVSQKTEAKSVEYVLSVLRDSRQAASIVTEAFKDAGVSDNEFLTSKLYEILYNRNGWSTGLILRNMAILAVLAALYGRKVTIVTTNYDTFIETELLKRYNNLIEGGLDGTIRPRTYRTVYHPDEKERPVEILGPLGDCGEIELIYLHGRVDPAHNESEGLIVLTEDSYSRTREQSEEILRRHFGRSEDGSTKGVLIVGASLSDGPLVDALAKTREAAPPAGAARQFRVALTDLPLTDQELAQEFESSDKPTKVTTKNIMSALGLRGQHLGLTLLWPASHAQSAQFLEELRVNLSAREPGGEDRAYRADGRMLSYSARLDLWQAEFLSSRSMLDPEFVYRRLGLMKNAISDILVAYGLVALDERLRVELWARVDLAERSMTLIGNSTGPLLDRDVLRSEQIATLSTSTISAFREGRPLLASAESLGSGWQASRWKTFFSIPIFVHVAADENSVGGQVPVGVITLASTLSATREIDGKRSVFYELPPKAFQELKVLLISAGRALLDPNLIEDEPDADVDGSALPAAD